MSVLVDSHIHLDDQRFDFDRQELIKMAQLSGVGRFIVPAVSVNRFPAVLKVAEDHPTVSYTLGLHPYYIDEHTATGLEFLAKSLQGSGAVGVGECGLDYYLKNLDRDKQQKVFEAQVILAKHFDLPLVLHVRGAVDDVFKTLKKHDYFKAVMHSFNGSVEQAQQITEKGIYLGFGPAVCNPKANKLQQLIKSVPVELMMLETDAPDQPFYDRAGKRNLPIDLLRVNLEIAAIKGVEPDFLAAQTTANANHLFKL
ncbi:TatD family hydrolase [Marinicella sp. S1101]|uniref:TatD family hydrolase n=1 Tax=Marinicella marina TaxID=2996016 RepID=UPI0024BBFB6E|nr:TatD family hydrolase [Marinicella marina]MCX7552806.1 TatD family hydrolase [Marinicella marina]MDJ1139885.1 TatD family hydrolase [Marinicella marina]